jgi:hypothetical protein
MSNVRYLGLCSDPPDTLNKLQNNHSTAQQQRNYLCGTAVCVLLDASLVARIMSGPALLACWSAGCWVRLCPQVVVYACPLFAIRC